MPKYAHIENKYVIDPYDAPTIEDYKYRFGDLANSWDIIIVPEGTEPSAIDNGDGTYTNPPSPQAPDPVYKAITEIEFIILCQNAGGMTDNMLVACQDDPRCKAMWIKFKASTTLNKDNALVQSGLTSIAQYGYLPNGVAAVNAAWPVV